MDEFEKKALENISRYGCHILNVLEDNLPGFLYSIGIEKTLSQPEVIIIGLKSEPAHWMINEYCHRLQNGEIFEPGKFYSGFLEGFDVTFIDVAKKHYKEHFGWGLWLYGHPNFKVLQMVWPTTEGKWPWDQDTTEYYKWAQPILNETGNIEKI